MISMIKNLMKMMREKIEMKTINKPINTKTNCLCKSSKEQICNTQRDDDDLRKERDEVFE